MSLSPLAAPLCSALVSRFCRLQIPGMISPRDKEHFVKYKEIFCSVVRVCDILILTSSSSLVVGVTMTANF